MSGWNGLCGFKNKNRFAQIEKPKNWNKIVENGSNQYSK